MVTTWPSNAWDMGLILGWGAKIPHDSGPINQNVKQKPYCDKLNKDFKNGPHQKIFKKGSQTIQNKIISVIMPHK